MKISVLIPAFNEENKIAQTVSAIKNTNMATEIIVVDDGSKDNTSTKAKAAGATVISLEENRGKGTALNMGASYVTGDIICLLDGDLGTSAKDMVKLVKPIIEQKAHMTIGKFPIKRKKAGFGFVKKLASSGIFFYTGKKFQEPLSGQRVLTKQAFDSLLPMANGYGVEVALTIKAIKKGYTVIEVDTNMSHEETGRNLAGFWHRGGQFVQVFKTLLWMKGFKT